MLAVELPAWVLKVELPIRMQTVGPQHGTRHPPLLTHTQLVGRRQHGMYRPEHPYAQRGQTPAWNAQACMPNPYSSGGSSGTTGGWGGATPKPGGGRGDSGGSWGGSSPAWGQAPAFEQTNI